jgi:aquaporin NIP
MISNRERLIAEFFGTYCLVFAGTGAIVVDELFGQVTHVGIALTFGLIVLAMIYSLGDVSGCHLNPAVTLGLYLARRFERNLVLPYIASQLLGATIASVSLRGIFPASVNLGATHPSGSWSQSFCLEVVLTLILMVVILRVSSPFAGIAIGSVIALEAMFAGPVCGASMNPARSFGPALVSGQLLDLPIYIAAPILGAIAATIVDRLIHEPRQDKESRPGAQ